MGGTPSRGDAVSAYLPPFDPRFSAKVYAANIKAAFLSGTLVSGAKTTAIAHGLGVKPKHVNVCAIATLGQTTAKHTVTLAAASAATNANFYLIGSQATNAAIKYSAFVILQ